MDALSEALNAVRMTGAIFFNAEFTAPWGFTVPHARALARVLSPQPEHLVHYHLLIEGKAVVQIEGTPDVPAVGGDIVIFPHGDRHSVSSGSPSRMVDTAGALSKFLAGDLSATRFGGGGETTRFVCGYFACDRHAERLFLAGLPAMIKINVRGDASGGWLENSIQHLVKEAESRRAGSMVLLAKMAETLFIEALRRYMERLPEDQIGWLAGARDSVVGTALALLHRKPCHPWTAAELAAAAGTSRSVLAERFARFLNEPPLTYLARWRLQLAARRLQTTRNTVLQIASGVGYESEAAFNRAFKREFGLPPAQYRKKVRENGALRSPVV
jgi:AraC-like DNA-binding protein